MPVCPRMDGGLYAVGAAGVTALAAPPGPCARPGVCGRSSYASSAAGCHTASYSTFRTTRPTRARAVSVPELRRPRAQPKRTRPAPSVCCEATAGVPSTLDAFPSARGSSVSGFFRGVAPSAGGTLESPRNRPSCQGAAATVSKIKERHKGPQRESFRPSIVLGSRLFPCGRCERKMDATHAPPRAAGTGRRRCTTTP